VGTNVGLTDGGSVVKDGSSEGIRVGIDVGSFVGVNVGIFVDSEDGFSVGDSLGV